MLSSVWATTKGYSREAEGVTEESACNQKSTARVSSNIINLDFFLHRCPHSTLFHQHHPLPPFPTHFSTLLLSLVFLTPSLSSSSSLSLHHLLTSVLLSSLHTPLSLPSTSRLSSQTTVRTHTGWTDWDGTQQWADWTAKVSFQWLLNRLLHKWREGYLVPTWA